MGNSSKSKAKDPSEQDVPETKPESSHHFEGLGKLYVPLRRTLKKRSSCSACGRTCLKIMFVCLAIVTILKSIVTIAVSMSTAIATKIYSSDVSGRMVAMILLAVTAAVTLSIAIYALVAVFTSHKKPLHATTVVLIILSIIQAVVIGVAVKVTPEDEVDLGRYLSDSFKLAREDNPRHVKIWAATQSDLSCCGVYSAEDYRSPRLPLYFSPDVPISCCPSYDSERSELVQEKERETCKAKKLFFDVGCKSLVLEVFRDSSTIVMSCTIALIVLEVILAILSTILSKEKKTEEEMDANKSQNKPKP